MIDRTGRQLDKYRLLRHLGRGGFADVYLAEHIFLRSQVAVKVLHTHLQLVQGTIDDFMKEAQTLAQLRSPHIVRVFDFGVDSSDNSVYLVMDYAPQGSLRTLHPQGSIVPLEKVVSYVKQVADALQHAHDAKIIHRDVKPENMLLGPNNEVILSDFGLAAVAHNTSSLKTQSDAGTIYYMAPEQIRGKPRPASDQYALAVTVYEWLSGQRPFDGSIAIEIAMQHMSDEPSPLKDKVSSISPEVEQIVMKGLAKDPAQRYGSVREFAEALESVSKPEQRQVLIEKVRSVVEENTRKRVPVGTTLVTHSGYSHLVAWSPDGKRLSSIGHDLNVAEVWEASSGKTIASCKGHVGTIWSVAWSPDGKRIATASNDMTVQVWEVDSGKRILKYERHANGIAAASVAWSPDGTILASTEWGNRGVRMWKSSNGQELFVYRGYVGSVYKVAWSPDGKRMATTAGNTIQIWDSSSGKILLTYTGHSDGVVSVVWSPDGSRLASASTDKTVQVWEMNSRMMIVKHEWLGSSLSVADVVAWAPNGKRLVSLASEKVVEIWDVSNGKTLFVYDGHGTRVKAASWSPDGTRIASASENDIQVWQAV